MKIFRFEFLVCKLHCKMMKFYLMNLHSSQGFNLFSALYTQRFPDLCKLITPINALQILYNEFPMYGCPLIRFNTSCAFMGLLYHRIVLDSEPPDNHYAGIFSYDSCNLAGERVSFTKHSRYMMFEVILKTKKSKITFIFIVSSDQLFEEICG